MDARHKVALDEAFRYLRESNELAKDKKFDQACYISNIAIFTLLSCVFKKISGDGVNVEDL